MTNYRPIGNDGDALLGRAPKSPLLGANVKIKLYDRAAFWYGRITYISNYTLARIVTIDKFENKWSPTDAAAKWIPLDAIEWVEEL